jgi:hypothetical protein
VRILMWDVHGGYTDSLLAGSDDYLFLPPETSGRGGLARYGSSPPGNAYEVTAEELRDHPPEWFCCKGWRRLSSVPNTSIAGRDRICQRSS